MRRAEAALRKIRLRDQLLDPEVSGIAGTSVDMIFSYEMARWCAASDGSRQGLTAAEILALLPPEFDA